MITIHIDPTETDPRKGMRIVEQEQRNQRILTKNFLGMILLGLTLLTAIFGFFINILS